MSQVRLASRLKILRNKNSLTVMEVAERSGVPRSAFEKRELLGAPETVNHVVRVADELGVEIRDLYGTDGK